MYFSLKWPREKRFFSLSYWWGKKSQSNKELDFLTYLNTSFGSLKLCRYLKCIKCCKSASQSVSCIQVQSLSGTSPSPHPMAWFPWEENLCTQDVEPWSATAMQFKLGQKHVNRFLESTRCLIYVVLYDKQAQDILLSMFFSYSAFKWLLKITEVACGYNHWDIPSAVSIKAH